MRTRPDHAATAAPELLDPRQARTRPDHAKGAGGPGPEPVDPDTAHAYLVWLSPTASPHLGQEFPVVGALCSVGRSRDNAVVVDCDSVSRHHLAIVLHGGRHFVRPGQATNGTCVDDQKIEAMAALRDGCRLRLGGAVFKFYLPGNPELEYHRANRHRFSHDGLTGLLTKEALQAWLQVRLDERRTAERPLGLVLLDVDHFKAVNDAFGHFAGDQCLVTLATRLGQAASGCDLVARLGGDELVAVRDDVPEAGLRRLAEHLRTAPARDAYDVLSASSRLRLSAGAVWWDGRSPVRDPWVLLGQAVDAMKLAKRQGRDRLVCVRHGEAPPAPRRAAPSPRAAEVTQVFLQVPVLHVDAFRKVLAATRGQHVVAARVVERSRVASERGRDRLDQLERVLEEAVREGLGAGALVGHDPDTGVVLGALDAPPPAELAALVEGRFAQLRDEERLPGERVVCSPAFTGARDAMVTPAIRALESLELDRRRDSRLPVPLAVSLRTLELQRGPAEQAHALVQLGEGMTRWLAILLAADLRDRREVPPPPLGERLRSGSAAGRWLGLLRRYLDAHRQLATTESRLPSLVAGLRARSPRGTRWPAVLEKLNTARNDVLHGGAADQTRGAEKLVARHRQAVLDLLAGPLAFLQDLAPVVVEDVDLGQEGPAGGTFVYDVHWLTGDHLVAPRSRIVSARRMHRGHLYAYSRADDAALALEPLAVSARCELCQRRELFFLDRVVRRRVHWVSLGIGHPLPLEGEATPWDAEAAEIVRVL